MTDKDIYGKLSAYHDGEVSIETTSQIEQELAAKPEWQALLLQIQHIDSGTKAVFGDLLSEPVQMQHVAAIEAAFANRQRGKTSWWCSPWFTAVAASIFAVLATSAIGFVAFERYDEQIYQEIVADREARQLMLATVLQDALEKRVSGTATEYADPAKRVIYKVVPLYTYKSASGHWCREFSERVERDGIVEIRKGLACREKQGQWHRLSTTIDGTL